MTVQSFINRLVNPRNLYSKPYCPKTRSLDIGFYVQLHGLNHVFGLQDSIQIFFGKNVVFQNQFIDTFSRFKRASLAILVEFYNR